MHKGVAAAGAAALFLLAGCSGDDAGAGPDASTPSVSGDPSAAAFTGLRFPLAAPFHKVVWANGTVAPNETCNTGGCIGDPPAAVKFHDITADLPKGVPAHVIATLDFEVGPFYNFGGGFNIFMQMTGGSFFLYRYTNEQPPGGHVVVEVVIQPGELVEVVFVPNGPSNAGDTPYTLSIEMSSHPVALPSGVPVAVNVEGGDEIRVQTLAGADSAFLLYTPNDAFVGRFQGNHTLPANAPRGEYALLIPFGEPDGNVSTDGGDDEFDLLGMAFEYGPEGTMNANGAYDADWDATGDLIGVGFRVATPPSPVGLAPMFSNGFTAEMTGPAGFQLPMGAGDGVYITFQFYAEVGSGLGDERVIAGTYHLHAETVMTYDVRIQPYAVYFERG